MNIDPSAAGSVSLVSDRGPRVRRRRRTLAAAVVVAEGGRRGSASLHGDSESLIHEVKDAQKDLPQDPSTLQRMSSTLEHHFQRRVRKRGNKAFPQQNGAPWREAVPKRSRLDLCGLEWY